MAQFSKVFFPYDPLPAQDLNDIVGFMNGIADGTNLEDEAVTARTLAQSASDLLGSYSLSEVATPYKWVDGKTIYKKTINFGALPNATTKSVAHGIAGLDKVIRIEGWANSGSAFFPLPHVAMTGLSYGVGVNVVGSNINVEAGIDRSSYTAFITLHYTKA